jgi:hypothetical protein
MSDASRMKVSAVILDYDRISVTELDGAENAARACGYDYPISRTLQFITDNLDVLTEALIAYRKEELAQELERIDRQIMAGTF